MARPLTWEPSVKHLSVFLGLGPSKHCRGTPVYTEASWKQLKVPKVPQNLHSIYVQHVPVTDDA